MGNENSSNITWPSALVLAIICLGALAWRALCPPTADDFFYRMFYPVSSIWHPVKDIKSWGDIFESIRLHYLMYNGRFSNYLAYILLYLPRWIEVLFCSILVAMVPILTLMFVGGKKALTQSLNLSVCAIAIWIFCPWFDSMQSTDFLLNYILPSDTMLLLMIIWKRKQTWESYRWVWYFPLLLILSCLHEAFTGLFITWAGVDTLVNWRNRIPWRKVIGWLCAVCGFIIIMSSPGTLQDINSNLPSKLVLHPLLIYSALGIWVFFAMLIYYFVLQKISREKKKELLPIVVVILVGLIFYILLRMPSRVMFPMAIMSIAGMMLLLDNKKRETSKRQSLICTFCTLLLCGFYAGLAYWTNIAREEYERVKSEVLRTNNNIVFVDMRHLEDLPIWLLKIPQFDRYRNRVHAMFESGYLLHKNGAIFPFPKSWEDKTIDEWPSLPGLPDFHEVWPELMVSKRYIKDLEMEVEYSDSLIAPYFKFKFYKFLFGFDKNNRALLRFNSIPIGVHQGDSLYGYYMEGSHYRFAGRKPANCKIVSGEEQP